MINSDDAGRLMDGSISDHDKKLAGLSFNCPVIKQANIALNRKKLVGITAHIDAIIAGISHMPEAAATVKLLNRVKYGE